MLRRLPQLLLGSENEQIEGEGLLPTPCIYWAGMDCRQPVAEPRPGGRTLPFICSFPEPRRSWGSVRSIAGLFRRLWVSFLSLRNAYGVPGAPQGSEIGMCPFLNDIRAK